MTEKTDIEALRDKLELALKDLTERLTDCHRLNFCIDELSAFAAFSSTVIDQFEAALKQVNQLDAENTGLHLIMGNMRDNAESSPVVNVVEVMRAVLGPMDASGSRKAVTELLEAAGIVVKDGEFCN